MKQKKMLALTFSQLKQIYNQEIPEVVEIADKSSSVEEFKAGMLRFLEICRIENEAAEEAREQIRLLLDYDGQNVHELSTGQDMSVQTIRLLYEFLTGTLENMEIPTDLFIEIFQMFKRLKGEVVPLPSPQRIKSRNDRWETGLDEEVREVRDILITGGDALMSQNKTLQNILDAVYRMAARKQRANLERKDGEKYAELQRVRLGSRLLAYLPMRINDGLVDVLREFKEKASAIGVKQFIIQTHFQTPLEVTPEAKETIRKILSAGWIITNQLVYTVAASRRGHTTRLRQVLNSLGVVCYYTFSVKGFNENYAVFAPNSRSMQEQQEEKIYGRMTPEQAEELYKILETKVGTEEEPKEDVAKQLRRFMRKHHLPFLATDRSVLNLPAIGKSMTFQLVGLTEEGKRILRFEHDGTRHHSPIIDQMGQIYIVENKSLAAYLRQLAKMGEDPEDYASIWNYTKGETEPRFSLYEYPDFPFRTTDKMSNLSIKN